MDEELVNKIDEAAKAEYASRSDFLRKLAVEHLDAERKESARAAFLKRKAARKNKSSDGEVLDAAREILNEYRQDFENLSRR